MPQDLPYPAPQIAVLDKKTHHVETPGDGRNVCQRSGEMGGEKTRPSPGQGCVHGMQEAAVPGSRQGLEQFQITHGGGINLQHRPAGKRLRRGETGQASFLGQLHIVHHRAGR